MLGSRKTVLLFMRPERMMLEQPVDSARRNSISVNVRRNA